MGTAGPTVRHESNLRSDLARYGIMSATDPRFPLMDVAFVEWEDPPTRCRLSCVIGCHGCGEKYSQERTDFFGYLGGAGDACPSCGDTVELLTATWGFEDGVKVDFPGMYVAAMPHTSLQGQTLQPVRLMIEEIEPAPDDA